MPSALIRFYGPDYAPDYAHDDTAPRQVRLVSLYADNTGEPNQVLPQVDAAIQSIQSALDGTEGLLWHLLPSTTGGTTPAWMLTAEEPNTLPVDWSYTVTHDGTQSGYQVTVSSRTAKGPGGIGELPKMLKVGATSLLAAYEGKPPTAGGPGVP